MSYLTAYNVHFVENGQRYVFAESVEQIWKQYEEQDREIEEVLKFATDVEVLGWEEKSLVENVDTEDPQETAGD